MAAIEPQKRVSFEAELLKTLRESIAGFHIVDMSGQGASNKFDVPGWHLPPLRQFQYGDFRIELPTTTVIVETESAGGVGNLVKYWPLLRSGTLAKRLVILHVYMLSSDADYIAHRMLWSFLVERMSEDLAANGVSRPGQWEAHIVTYRKGEPPDEVTALLRKTLKETGGVAHTHINAPPGSDALRVKRGWSTGVRGRHSVLLSGGPGRRRLHARPRSSGPVVSTRVSMLPLWSNTVSDCGAATVPSLEWGSRTVRPALVRVAWIG